MQEWNARTLRDAARIRFVLLAVFEFLLIVGGTQTALSQQETKHVVHSAPPVVEKEKSSWEEKVKNLTEAIVPVTALIWAVWRFGLNRGRFTFLDLELTASV